MKISVVGICLATFLAFLLSWWLWSMGIGDVQKWLLSCVGGFVIWIGLIGGMAVKYEAERSGMQVRLIYNILSCVTFLASCIYSFFVFSPVSYVVPIGVFLVLCVSLGAKIYKSGE